MAKIPDWLDVSRETLDDLEALEALVRRWTSAVNLISKSTVPDIWSRHILDSAQISVFSGFQGGTWADLGSGGGFPGLVLAVLAKRLSPSTEFVLIESDVRKATFLRQASQTLTLNAKVLTSRISESPALSALAMSARALAPLETLLEYAQLHLAPSGKAFFPKGASYEAEVEAAKARWRFKLNTHPSLTDPTAAILEVSEIEVR